MPDTCFSILSRYPDKPLHETDEKWWVAKVKPRQEKLLAKDFYENGIEYYLPLYQKNTPRKGSSSPRLFSVPLFPGYISFSQEKPHNIFISGRVVTIIEVRNQKKFIKELNQIYYLLQGKAPIEPAVDVSLAEGTPVKIIHGPFAGITGVIQNGVLKTQVVISVECLGSAILKVDKSWIEINEAGK